MLEVLPFFVMSVALAALGAWTLTHGDQAWALLRRFPGWSRIPEERSDASPVLRSALVIWAAWLLVCGTLFAVTMLAFIVVSG